MNLTRGWRLVALAAVGVAISACGSPSDNEPIDSSGPASDNPASSDSPGSSNGGVVHLHGKKNGIERPSSDGTGSDDSDAGTSGSNTGDDSGAAGSDAGGGNADSDSDAGGGNTDSDAGSTGSDAGSSGGGITDPDAGGGGGGGDVSDGGSSQPPSSGGPMLNLSSISCTDNGTVDVHFVLLFAGTATPGDLSGTYNGGSFGPSAPERNTGNVWHYDVFLPAGDIDITSAEVTALGQTIELHNPDAYADTYSCGAPPPPACSVQVSAQDEICLDKPLGSETAECNYFGLSLIAKDLPTSASNTFPSTQNALLAIVKTGTGDCGPGMAAYRTYTDVTVGEMLSAPGGQNISHVTYCKCPDSL